jgi:PLP dependent protein
MPITPASLDTDGRADVLARLIDVRRRIAAAAEAAGRQPEDVTLVTITKTFAADAIEPVLEAGLRVFGENRVQEAASKWPSLKQRWPDIELHLVGPLQTNKTAEAVALFDCIETLDRPKLARALAKEFDRQGRTLELFIQVNTGAEPQKAGVLPGEADRFIADCRESHGLAIAGLMAIPPLDEEPALHFALLDKIARRNGLAKLSMGMSGDFETAIALGATHVRLGTAIFGDRPRPGG